SRHMVDTALQALANLRHRGALAADAKTGDGAGILLPLAPGFWARAAGEVGATDVHPGDVGVAMCFLSPDEAEQDRGRKALLEACTAENVDVLAWRDVPVDTDAIGEMALASAP